MRFVSFGGAERCQVGVEPPAPLSGVRDALAADHRAGRLGPGFGRVDAVLPGGGLLSRALATETVAGAFGLPPAGAAPGGQSGPSGASSSRGPAEGNAVGAFWGARGKGSSDSREGHAEMR